MGCSSERGESKARFKGLYYLNLKIEKQTSVDFVTF